MDTPITLPADLKKKIDREANELGMSPQDFVRKSLEWVISRKQSADPLFADAAVFLDKGATDLASNHDDYLYGDGS